MSTLFLSSLESTDDLDPRFMIEKIDRMQAYSPATDPSEAGNQVPSPGKPV